MSNRDRRSRGARGGQQGVGATGTASAPAASPSGDAVPASKGRPSPVVLKFNSGELLQAVNVLDYLNEFRTDTLTFVQISRMRRLFRGHAADVIAAVERVEETTRRLVAEHGTENPDTGALEIAPKTPEYAIYRREMEPLQRELDALLRTGEHVIRVEEPLRYSALTFKNRDPGTGRLETLPIPLSGADMDALRDALFLDAPGATAGERNA